MKVIIWLATYILIGISLNVFFTIIARITDKFVKKGSLEDSLIDGINDAYEFVETQNESPDGMKIPPWAFMAISLICWPITLPVGAVVTYMRYKEGQK